MQLGGRRNEIWVTKLKKIAENVENERVRKAIFNGKRKNLAQTFLFTIFSLIV